MRSWVGVTLNGRYGVEAPLRAGGMAAVYRARDERLAGRPVVVKHPLREADRRSSGLSDEDLRARFEREISRLIHLDRIPGVVRILDQGVHEGTPFYVMEHMAGGDLSDRLAQGPQAPEEALTWAAPLARTLDEVHRQGFLHRDVKPANILFDAPGPEGVARLADFGIVKELSAEWGTTGVNTGIGTPGYMAPEQLLPDALPDGRCDQYALAATLYVALTGKPPVYETTGGGPTPGARGTPGPGLRRRLRPVNADDLAPHVPAAAAAALTRALAREPGERFATCTEFIAAFAAGLAATSPLPAPGAATWRPGATGQGRGTRHRPAAPPGGPAPEPRGRTRRWLVLGLLALGVSAGGVALWMRSRPDPDRAPSTLPQPASPVPTPQPAPGPLDLTPPRLVVTSPAEAESVTTDGRVDVVGRVTDEGGATAGLTLHDGPIAIPLEPSGAFRHQVLVPEDTVRAVSVVARDAAGNASSPVERRLRRGSPWDAALREATQAGAEADWPKASAAWARARGLGAPTEQLDGALRASLQAWEVLQQAVAAARAGRWEEAEQNLSNWTAPRGVEIPADVAAGLAPARVEIDEPPEGARVAAERVTLKGRVRGRPTDSVRVLGVRATLADGAFTLDVPLPNLGETRLIVEVLSGERSRGPSAVRRLRRVESWATFLLDWAEPVPEAGFDALTAYPKKIKRLRDGAVMVLVPGGKVTSFRLAREGDEPSTPGIEAPAETVVLRRSYYLDETEVTNAQYGAFAKATGYRTEAEVRGSDAMLNPMGGFSETGAKVTWRLPYTFQPLGPTFEREPVIKVAWVDCMQFGAWVGCSLPTVSQFVRALRGGLEGKRHPWGDADMPPRPIENLADASLNRLGWFLRPETAYDDGFPFIAPVRSFPPNPLGVHDLGGNVLEWCLEAVPGTVTGLDERPATRHYILGGDWIAAPESLRADTHTALTGSGMTHGVGFRCAKTLPFDAFAEDGSPQ